MTGFCSVGAGGFLKRKGPSSSGLGCRAFNPDDVGSNPTGPTIPELSEVKPEACLRRGSPEPANAGRRAAMHVVITGRLNVAIADWWHRLLWFNPLTMRGETVDGEVWFLLGDQPDRLRGMHIASYELHPSVELLPAYRVRETEAVAQSRVR